MSQLQTIRNMQLDHAMFELEVHALVHARIAERLVVAVLAGGTTILSGPAGVGKSHVAALVANVFGISHQTVVANEDSMRFVVESSPDLLIVEDIDRLPESGQNDLAATLRRGDGRLLVGTLTTAARPVDATGATSLTRRLRDACLMSVEVPYPEPAEEQSTVLRTLLAVPTADRILNMSDFQALQSAVADVAVDDSVVAYAVRIANATRAPEDFGLDNLVGLASGASPRASVALVHAARALALLRGRWHVVVQDVFDVAYEVLALRLEPTRTALLRGIGVGDILVETLSRVPAVPA